MAEIRISTLRGTGSGAGEISLVGPATVLPGSTNTFTITDYDSFSEYSVLTSVGTATLSNETITLVIPSGSTGTSVSLSVSRNSSTRVFQLALGTSGVATPSIVSPQNGTTNVPTSVTLQATQFATIPAGVGVQESSEWEVARDAGFTDIVASANISTGDMTRYTTSNLPRNTTLYARVRYVANIATSGWSNTISFTTTSQQINKPTVSIVGQDFDVQETPTFNSSAFSVTPAGSDTHVASTWVIRLAADDSVVWQLNNSSVNKLSVTIPQGVLSVDTVYTIEVKYIGGFGESVFSDKLTFATAQSFIPNTPGTPFGGGYYAGRIDVGGQIYAIVVAPKALGGESSSKLLWKSTATTTAGTDSRNDGWANTNAMESFISLYPAGQFCKGLSIGGYNDWYLPAQDELEILYRVFKPTTQNNHSNSGANPSSVPPTSNYTSGNPAQTSIALFQQGGAEAFQTDYYWTSTQSSATAARYGRFSDGVQNTYNKTQSYWVRAVRRVLIS